jgi:DNA-binding transcriptional ArsR family regulator
VNNSIKEVNSKRFKWFLRIPIHRMTYLMAYQSKTRETFIIYIIISLVNYMSMSIQLQRLSLKAKLFRGLGDSTRLSILELLRDSEKSTSEIVKDTGHSQSNVSNHLSCLLDCGLVQNRREGKSIFYSLRNKKVSKILEESDAILSEVARGIYECVNYNEEPKKR